MMKTAIGIVLLVSGVTVLRAQEDTTALHLKAGKNQISSREDSGHLVDSVLHYAQSFIGCRYGFGSCGPQTFDCSGFVMHVFGKHGITLPHGSATQKSICEEIKLKKVRPGDLLFFAGRKVSKSKIGHVAIVKSVQGDRITMIHATVQSGVITEVMQDSEYFSKRFISAGRLKELD
jgi:cell wall-associated NlpC family hydrolase